MKTIIYNQDLLDEKDVKYRSIRLKALIINSKNELLVGYSHNTYQFIGGHLEEGEDLIEGLIREVEEEAGIKVEKEEIKPFFLRKKYYKNYPEENANSCYEYHYYVINTDRLPDLTKVNYTEAEKVGKFELRYIPIEKIEEEFEENKKVSERTKIVEEENIEAIKIFKSM
ncbi:MAG: NUDIX hydrolase [Bacilli bacterium]|nr:NUDIX hydrolase [Bacilli bacterium]